MPRTRYNLVHSRVLDTRTSKNGLTIKRRRKCDKSGRRFTTIEQIIRVGIFVIKRDGHREAFDREKMTGGIQKATEKRPIQAEQVEMLINDIMDRLEEEYDTDIPSHIIGEEIMDRLKQIDHIAYVRFASVYKDFRDLNELKADLNSLTDT